MSDSGPPGWSIPETPAGPPWPEERPAGPPWREERPTPVDRPPSDPWGDQVGWAAEPIGGAPAPPTAEPAPPAAGPAPPSPERPATDRRQTVLLLLVAVLALVLGTGGFTAYMLSDRADRPAASGSATPRGAATATAAAAAPTGEFRAITAGECMVNDGTDEDPKPRRVACGPGTYEVLRRFDGTIDYAKNCATVTGYQFHFSYDSNLDTLDFVLCLRKRT